MGIEDKSSKSKNYRENESTAVPDRSKPKEWKAGSGNNGWGLDNMHPSWAAKKNAEQENLGSISRAPKAVKIIDL